jgi:two-component system, NarL family, invasion response regulator UvrY
MPASVCGVIGLHPRARARAAHHPHRVTTRAGGGASMSGMPVGVVIVDDQAVFRAAARELVDATPGFHAVGEAASGPDGLRLVDDLDPELVLVDMRMPGMDGVETARRMTGRHPRSVVVLVSTVDSTDLPAAASQSGACAFLRKQDFGRAALVAIWAQHGGE